MVPCRELWDRQAGMSEFQLRQVTALRPWERYVTGGVSVTSYNRQEIVKPLQDCGAN